MGTVGSVCPARGSAPAHPTDNKAGFVGIPARQGWKEDFWNSSADIHGQLLPRVRGQGWEHTKLFVWEFNEEMMKAEPAKAGPPLLSPGNVRGKREKGRGLSWMQPRKAHGEDGAGQSQAEQFLFAILQHPSPV